MDEATGERNRVSVVFLRKLNGFRFANIPDGSYIRIAKANEHACQLLIWDGCKTGYPVSALSTCFNDKAEMERLPSDASACIQVPKSALYMIAKPGYTFMNLVTSNTSVSQPIASAEIRFPSQFLYLRGFYGAGRPKNVRIVRDYDYMTGKHAQEMPDTDLSDEVIVIDKSVFQSSAHLDTADPVFKNIEACTNFIWTAKADIFDNRGSNGTGSGLVGIYREGTTYHGIPYRSGWSTPIFVGWHVSKQTFMNAANDPDSIFYHNPSKGNPGPYYSLVWDRSRGVRQNGCV